MDAGSKLINELRGYVIAFTEFTILFAESANLPTTDGTARAEIAWADRAGAPLSAARLSERIGLTSSATNALVTRLERGGHLHRTRESTDRRIVSLRPSEEAKAQIECFAAHAAPEVQAVLDGFDPAHVDLVAETVATLTAAMRSTNRHLRHAQP
jgi:DNA-binding MarR family transcriptional regulator